MAETGTTQLTASSLVPGITFHGILIPSRASSSRNSDILHTAVLCANCVRRPPQVKWYPTGGEEAADLRTLPRREKLEGRSPPSAGQPHRRPCRRSWGLGAGGDRGGTVERAMRSGFRRGLCSQATRGEG